MLSQDVPRDERVIRQFPPTRKPMQQVKGGSLSLQSSMRDDETSTPIQAPAQTPGTVAPSLQDLIDSSSEGDCIYVAPGTYTLAGPLRVSRDLFMIGFDDSNGDGIVLRYDAGCLVPTLAAIRVDGPARTLSSTTRTTSKTLTVRGPQKPTRSSSDQTRRLK